MCERADSPALAAKRALCFVIKKVSTSEIICVAMAARRLSSLLSRSLSVSGSASLLLSRGEGSYHALLDWFFFFFTVDEDGDYVFSMILLVFLSV